jgi:uncharacterized spore protein YtfJ
MMVNELVTSASDMITVRRVYAEPYTHDGVTVIAAAAVSGGGGGGAGRDQQNQEGEGGGFGVRGRPSGAYVIKDGNVQWVPAVDVNRIIVMAGVVACAAMLTKLRLAKRAARALI